MEIKKKLNISAPCFYNKVIDSVLFDIQKTTGKSVSRKQLNGYEYIKQFSKYNRAKITIEEAIENHSYQFKTSTTRNEFVARYEVKPIDDQNCEVIYHENMKSFGFLQQLNDFVLGLVMGFFKRRHFIKMLEMMEQS